MGSPHFPHFGPLGVAAGTDGLGEASSFVVTVLVLVGADATVTVVTSVTVGRAVREKDGASGGGVSVAIEEVLSGLGMFAEELEMAAVREVAEL